MDGVEGRVDTDEIAAVLGGIGDDVDDVLVVWKLEVKELGDGSVEIDDAVVVPAIVGKYVDVTAEDAKVLALRAVGTGPGEDVAWEEGEVECWLVVGSCRLAVDVIPGEVAACEVVETCVELSSGRTVEKVELEESSLVGNLFFGVVPFDVGEIEVGS